MTSRPVTRLLRSQPASDGAGVRLYRNLGQNAGARLDPFLMLDEFRSDQPQEYIAGFPAHPHRGFETVTLMLAGRMRHEDSLGNRGVLEAGDVQWMTAAGGIVHAEMPEQENGLMHGFQLWINLPERDKMKPARYRDIRAGEIPQLSFAGGELRLVAGRLEWPDGIHEGPVVTHSLAPLIIDLGLEPGQELHLPVDAGHSALVYGYAGSLLVDGQPLGERESAFLGEGNRIHLRAGPAGGRALVLAARPIGEPVVQYGPFVMTSRAGIEQALADYREGRLSG